MVDRITLRVKEAAEALGVSRSKAYELIADGTIPAIRIGSAVRIPAEALREWIARQLAEQAGK